MQIEDTWVRWLTLFVIDSCSKKLSQPPFGKVPSMSLGTQVGSRTFQPTNPRGAPGETFTTTFRVVIPLAGCSPVKDTTLCLFLLVHKVPLFPNSRCHSTLMLLPYGGLSLSHELLVLLPYGGLSLSRAGAAPLEG